MDLTQLLLLIILIIVKDASAQTCNMNPLVAGTSIAVPTSVPTFTVSAPTITVGTTSKVTIDKVDWDMWGYFPFYTQGSISLASRYTRYTIPFLDRAGSAPTYTSYPSPSYSAAPNTNTRFPSPSPSPSSIYITPCPTPVPSVLTGGYVFTSVYDCVYLPLAGLYNVCLTLRASGTANTEFFISPALVNGGGPFSDTYFNLGFQHAYSSASIGALYSSTCWAVNSYTNGNYLTFGIGLQSNSAPFTLTFQCASYSDQCAFYIRLAAAL